MRYELNSMTDYCAYVPETGEWRIVMKHKKQWLSALSVLLLFTIFIGGCGKKNSTEKKIVTIGINQFLQHPVADEVARGILDGFSQNKINKENGYNIVVKNANGDNAVATQINKMFVRDNVAVIVPIATPAAQSACHETEKIPVVFAAITDPVKAGIADSLEHPGKNRTGTSNRWPFERQVSLIQKLIPNAKTVGMILNPAEANTEAALSYVRPALEKAGLKSVEVPVASSSEVYNAAKSLIGRCDVIFILPDNTLQGGFDALMKVAKSNKLPVIGGTGDLVERGSLASYAADHYRLGVATAEIVIDILKNGRDPGTIPVVMDHEAPLMVNEEMAHSLGITIPDTLR